MRGYRSRVRRPRRLAAPALAALVLVPALAGCGGDDDELVVYSGRTSDLIRPVLERFSDETGFDVAFRSGDSSDLALLIEEEGDRSPADVFISQSPGPLAFLAQSDRLAPLGASVTGRLAAAYRGQEDRWVGLSGRVRTLVYDSDEVDAADLPGSVFDLTDERYADSVALAPSNGSFQDFVSAMRLEVGDDRTLGWLEGMEANGSRTYANNDAIVQAVDRGEVRMGLVNHYYAEQLQEEDESTAARNHFFTEGDLGALLLLAGVGVLDGSDRTEDGQRLVEYLLGEESQRYFAEETLEYPLIEGVDPAADLEPLSSLPTAHFGLDELGGGLERTRELIEESGLEAG
ncbi:iron ABC transporter substrate-binding protein [soil metagenome]